MTFEEFNKLWAKAFGYRLTANTGAEAWADFVEDDRTNDGLVVKVLNEFSERYNRLIGEESPRAKDAVPTCDGFRNRYFAIRRESNQANFAPSGCRTCGGRGIVYALAPCRGDGDRVLAPEDWRTVSLDRVIPFAEAYNCPVCHAAAYNKRGEALRQRVIQNSLPEVVGADDPRNTHGVPLTGDRVIRWDIAARFAAGKKPAFDMADNALEHNFPMEARA